MNSHIFINSDPTKFDSNCTICGGKDRDSHHRPPSLQGTIKGLNQKDAEWFAEAFTHPVTRKPYDMPEDLKRLAARLCKSYGIYGTCDPMYVANVIAFELGLGDGQSNFNHTKS